MIKVLGIKIIDRIKEAGLTQKVLSKHASVITTRLGFHEVTDEVCSREAIIILHLNSDPATSEKLAAELVEIGGIEIPVSRQTVEFQQRLNTFEKPVILKQGRGGLVFEGISRPDKNGQIG